MSTVKSVRTLAIIFAFLIGIKHEVGCLRRTTEEFQQPGIELHSENPRPLGKDNGGRSVPASSISWNAAPPPEAIDRVRRAIPQPIVTGKARGGVGAGLGGCPNGTRLEVRGGMMGARPNPPGGCAWAMSGAVVSADDALGRDANRI